MSAIDEVDERSSEVGGLSEIGEVDGCLSELDGCPSETGDSASATDFGESSLDKLEIEVVANGIAPRIESDKPKKRRPFCKKEFTHLPEKG